MEIDDTVRDPDKDPIDDNRENAGKFTRKFYPEILSGNFIRKFYPERRSPRRTRIFQKTVQTKM